MMKNWSPDQDTQEWAGANRATLVAVERMVSRPWNGLSWGIGIAAVLAMLFYSWKLGLFLLIVAIAVDRRRYLCGNCGNKVLKSAMICPSCHVHIGVKKVMFKG